MPSSRSGVEPEPVDEVGGRAGRLGALDVLGVGGQHGIGIAASSASAIACRARSFSARVASASPWLAVRARSAACRTGVWELMTRA